MSVYQVFSVSTILGSDVSPLAAASFDWSRALSAGAGGTVVLPLDDSGYSRSDLEHLTEEWMRTIVLDYGGKVVAAGIVQGREYDKLSRTLKLTLTDIWGVWARRGAWDHSAPDMQLWSQTYTDLSLGTLAKRAIERGTDGPPAPLMGLPVTLPSDVSGSVDRTYRGDQFELVRDVLDDLMAEGLDIDFRPRWVSGALDWLMRNDPNANTWEWSVDAPLGGVAGFREVTDGARVTNNARAIGSGQGADMVYRSNRNEDSPYPLLDRIDMRKNLDDVYRLFAVADNNLTMYGTPTNQWSFDVLASGSPGAGDIYMGDTARLIFSDDPWVETGVYERRIVRLSGGMGEKVTVTCQPTGGA